MSKLLATSEIEAVNALLATIGEAPINSLEGQLTTDASMALSTVHEVSREVQTEGWSFNTEEKYPLVPDQEGFIYLPSNCMSIIFPRPTLEEKNIVQRGMRLYDKEEHSYKFKRTLYADVIMLLPFEELPEAARRYITIRAARVFQQRVVGSDTLHKFNQWDELHARSILLDTESQVSNANILTGRDNVLNGGWSVFKTLAR